MIVKLTNHARIRAKERRISIKIVRKILNNPDKVVLLEKDKFIYFGKNKNKILKSSLYIMKITYDKEVDALYIYLKKGKIKETAAIGVDFIVDLDNKGDVIGVEILNASQKSSLKDKSSITIGKRTLHLPPLVID